VSALASFDIHGLLVDVSGSWTPVIDAVRLDLAWFESTVPDSRPDLELIVEEEAHDLASYGDVVASSIGPRCVAYRTPAGATVTDYLGLASSLVDEGGRRLRIHGPDPQLGHEIAFNGIRAAVLRHLDRAGMVGLHALGLAGRDGAVVVLLPSGGGKSSLALWALEDERVRFLSDDMPILDGRGMVHPFPLRIGVTVGDPVAHERGGRRIERLGWRPKLAVDIGEMADRVQQTPVPVAHVVAATRSLGRASRLEPADRRHVRRLLFQESVLRVATGQGAAWLTARRRIGPTLRKVPGVAHRARLCHGALRDAQAWRLVLGSDREGGWRALEPLLVDTVSRNGTGAAT